MALIEDAKNSRKRLNLNKYLEIFKRKTFLSFLMMSIKHKYKTFFVSICLINNIFFITKVFTC